MQEEIPEENYLYLWNEIILKKIEQKSIPACSILESHSILKNISKKEKTITITFKNKVFIELLKNGNKFKIVSNVIENIFGEKYQIILEHNPFQQINNTYESLSRKTLEEALNNNKINLSPLLKRILNL